MKLPAFLSFSGRAKRARFLQFIPIAIVLWLAAAWIDEQFLAPNLCHLNANWICYLPGEVRDGWTLDRVMALLLLWPLFSVLVRRMNDHQRSPLWVLLILPLLYITYLFLYRPEEPIPAVMLVGAIAVFLPLGYFLVRKGQS